MKKIMFFRSLYYMGGTEVAIINLIKNLSKEDYYIYIGYTDESFDKEIFNNLKEYANEFVNVSNKKVEVDILINCSASLTSAELLKNIKYTKLYQWLHYILNYDIFILNDIDILNLIDKIIFVSNTTVNKLHDHKYFNIIKEKSIVLNNIMDVTKLKQKSLVEIDKSLEFSKTLNLVTISRITYEKGFNRMLVLAKALKEKNIDFKWFVVGGNHSKEIENEIKSKFEDLKDNVIFLGILFDTSNIVVKCDYLVTLSDDETWGLTITEAKILHVPCIVTNFEAVFEQIEDGKNGIILDLNNTESYIEKVNTILTNKERLKANLNDYEYHNDSILKKWKEILN